MTTETPAPPKLDQTTLVWIMADLEDTLTTLRRERNLAHMEHRYDDALTYSAGAVALGTWAQHVIRTYTGKDHEELMEVAHNVPVHK